jgi:hypothetical protein
MFGSVLIFVLREFAEPIKDLIVATVANDKEARKIALVKLENAAEREAAKRALKRR